MSATSDRKLTHVWSQSPEMVGRAPTQPVVTPARSSPPWMLLRLAVETRTHHAHADEDRLTLLDASTLEQYRAHLVRIHAFEGAVEDALSTIGTLGALMIGRYRAAALRADLQALGITDIAGLPRCRQVHLRTVPQALGALFVIERHTLVAGVIRRQLVRRLGPWIQDATAYLNLYGDEPGRWFRALGDALGDFAQLHTPRAIATAANDCFRLQRQWYAAE